VTLYEHTVEPFFNSFYLKQKTKNEFKKMPEVGIKLEKTALGLGTSTINIVY
jgi:hypothetical protein